MPLAAAIGMTFSLRKIFPISSHSLTDALHAILAIYHIDNSCLLHTILFRNAVVCSEHCLVAMRKGPIIFTFDTCGKYLALWAIRAYQRHVSPWKGFSCAYRVLTGGDSCSAYGYRAIARHGLRVGLPVLQRRLRACGEQQRQHRALHAHGRRARHRAQAGYCDLPAADCGDCDCACDCADLVDLLNLRWPGRNNNSTRSGSGYASSAALKKQQAEHRRKIRQGQGHEH